MAATGLPPMRSCRWHYCGDRFDVLGGLWPTIAKATSLSSTSVAFPRSLLDECTRQRSTIPGDSFRVDPITALTSTSDMASQPSAIPLSLAAARPRAIASATVQWATLVAVGRPAGKGGHRLPGRSETRVLRRPAGVARHRFRLDAPEYPRHRIGDVPMASQHSELCQPAGVDTPESSPMHVRAAGTCSQSHGFGEIEVPATGPDPRALLDLRRLNRRRRLQPCPAWTAATMRTVPRTYRRCIRLSACTGRGGISKQVPTNTGCASSCALSGTCTRCSEPISRGSGAARPTPRFRLSRECTHESVATQRSMMIT